MDTIQSLQFDFQPWRNALPEAAGARLSDEEIIGITATTVAQCGALNLDDNSDKSWLTDPSILNVRLFLTYTYGDQKRKFGGSYRGTHPLGVAHKSYNRDRFPIGQTEKIMAAFTAVNHDSLEDISNKPTVRILALSLIVHGLNDSLGLWAGNPGLRFVLKRDIESLTDTPGLSTRARFREQIERARNGMTQRALCVRYDDKYDNTSTDEALVREGIIKDPAEIVARAKLARSKLSIIEELPDPITAEEKQAYILKTESLEAMAKAAIDETTKRHGDTGYKDLLRSAATIFRQFSRIPVAFF